MATKGVFLLAVVMIMVGTTALFGQRLPNSFPFSIASGGAASFNDLNSPDPLSVGFARVLPHTGSISPEAFEMLQFRQNGITLSETTMPASPLILNDRFYVEADGAVNTGVAISNPSS